MSRLQTPAHRRTRSFLRVAGPIVLLAGIAFMVTGAVSFFAAMDAHERPQRFWCVFVGMPVTFVGLMMTFAAYVGAVSRYMAAEGVPVAADATSDFVEGTEGAVESIARSTGRGLREGLKGSPPDDR